MSIHDWLIYQLVDSRHQGGIESHILNLTRWLNQNGYRSEVIFMRDFGTHPLKDKLTKEGLPYRCLSNYRELYKLLTHSPCIVNTHGYKAGIIGRIFGKLSSTPVISTFHSGDLGKGKLRFYSWLDYSTSILADRVLSVSDEISSRLPITSHQIANFVAPAKLQTERGKAVAFVGRLSDEKGPKAFARITEQLPKELPCHVYGDGPLKTGLEREYPHLNFFGQVEMDQHWGDIGLLCISSKSEGLPLVALEAMSRGIPVASYRLGAIPELIEDHKSGWLVNTGDEKTLGSVIANWWTQSGTDKAAMSIAAHHRICKYYSDSFVIPSILEIYAQAAHHKGFINLKFDRRTL
ncbi:glycosyltransferase family 4 protein [Neptuniibacter sp. QD29_5]|uniref:glycosyltransferase family 4 protein n=1 Tax=Neptuniibacter sp. QD29_5 TaxID=3398207 RepID=UPI0039F5C0FD